MGAVLTKCGILALVLVCLSIGWALTPHAFIPSHPFIPSCGADPAPTQAAAVGFTCQTFRWGSGDTAAEIDSTQSYAAGCDHPENSPCGGLKWYWATLDKNCHTTVAADISVSGSQIAIHTNPNTNTGCFVINTCGGANGGTGLYSVGKSFTHGWYVEAVMEWDATGHPSTQTGFYGIGMTSKQNTAPYNCSQNGAPGNSCFEVDDPDAFSFGQTVYDWPGVTPARNNDTGETTGASTVETGTTKWGVLSTTSATTYWVNDVANGSSTYDAGFGTANDLYKGNICWGPESTIGFTLFLDSVKIWQAPQ